MPQEILNKINELGIKQKQPEGITFQDIGESTTLSELHLDMDTGQHDGNVSDDDYEETSDDEREIEEENKYEEIGIDATETQGDHFFQQPEQHDDFDEDELEEQSTEENEDNDDNTDPDDGDESIDNDETDDEEANNDEVPNDTMNDQSFDHNDTPANLINDFGTA